MDRQKVKKLPKVKPTENNASKFSLHECVVCNGFGTLKYGAKICQACKGRGYIVINNETGEPVDDRGMDGNGQRLDKTT